MKTVTLSEWSLAALAHSVERTLERGELHEASGQALLDKLQRAGKCTLKIVDDPLDEERS